GSARLKPGAAQEGAPGRRHTVDDLHRQPRQPPRGGAADDTATVLGIELGLVTRTPESLALRLPHRDVAPGVRAHAGVGEDSVGGEGSRLVGELGGADTNQQELIEAGPIANHVAAGVHREGADRWSALGEVGGGDELASSIARLVDEAIAGLGALALGIATLGHRLAKGAQTEWKAHSDGERRSQHRAAVLPVTRPAPEPHMAASTSSSKRDTRRGDSGGAGGGSQDAPGDSRGARPRLTA